MRTVIAALTPAGGLLALVVCGGAASAFEEGFLTGPLDFEVSSDAGPLSLEQLRPADWLAIALTICNRVRSLGRRTSNYSHTIDIESGD